MKFKLLLAMLLCTFISTKFAFSADDDHDHDHAAHSDEPFYGHAGIRIHFDHVSDAGEGDEEVLAVRRQFGDGGDDLEVGITVFTVMLAQ